MRRAPRPALLAAPRDQIVEVAHDRISTEAVADACDAIVEDPDDVIPRFGELLDAFDQPLTLQPGAVDHDAPADAPRLGKPRVTVAAIARNVRISSTRDSIHEKAQSREIALDIFNANASAKEDHEHEPADGHDGGGAPERVHDRAKVVRADRVQAEQQQQRAEANSRELGRVVQIDATENAHHDHAGSHDSEEVQHADDPGNHALRERCRNRTPRENVLNGLNARRH